MLQSVKIHLGENGFIARSCVDFLKHGVLENGFYLLFDDQGQRYLAYCDLASEPGAAWTLVMSWSRTVDIRGSTAGKGTTLPFFQGQDRKFLHTDSTFTGCEFKPNVSSAVASEDNFGLYSDVNVKFRCTAGDYSTTQWWFGGYLTK